MDIHYRHINKRIRRESNNKKLIEVNASTSKVWDVFVNPANTKQWANAFSEGSLWKQIGKGKKVLWKDKENNIGAKGVVAANDFGSLLKVNFYDDVKMSSPASTGDYSEVYKLSEKDGKTFLSIEAGPLSVKDSNIHSPLWENAAAKIKELAEK